MAKRLNILKQLICLAAIIATMQPLGAAAQDAKGKKAAAEDPGSVSTILTPADKDARFDDKAVYEFDVKNTTDNEQVGKISYLVSTETDKNLKADSQMIKVPKKSTGKFRWTIPQDKPGYYKVAFMVNVTDYDDTIRKVFGIKPELLTSTHNKPADYHDYWKAAKDELAKIPPNFKVTKMPKITTTGNRYTYAIEMQSIGNMTIRGWMTLPKTVDKGKKFAVLLGLPGYQVNLTPMGGMDEDLAIITLNVRGQGNSRGPVNTRRDEFIFYHIEDKDKYVMRGVIMDCVRCIDFICAQKELNHDKILVSGGSMGGFLAIATAALDKRVALCSSQNPILCDVRSLPGEVDWPLNDINRYVAIQPGLTLDKVFNTLDYFDTKNFASEITCPILLGIGLLDPIAPPPNEYMAFNSITTSKNKRIMVFKDLGHEVNTAYKDLEGRWMRDHFALF